MAEHSQIEICRNELKQIIGSKKNAKDEKRLFFTKRCNKSLELAINIAVNALDSKKKKYLFIQQEGGWITYRKYAEKFNMVLVYLPMNAGKIDAEILHLELGKAQNNAIVLIHSLPGYSFCENMEKIKTTLEKAAIEKDNSNTQNSALLINDCCGSIGTESAKKGDIIVCSFGKAKPLSLEKEGASGGFICVHEFLLDADNLNALQNAEKEAIDSNLINFEKLKMQIEELPEKLKFLHSINDKIAGDLCMNGFSVLNRSAQGINVLVAYEDIAEKERLINYCTEHKIEFTECPRYIRTNKKALSLELKRIKFSKEIQ